ncbi:MAG: TIGR04255 family protein [Candidatus Manganitrophus sp.]|nr:MAG: TIGR04255 family protein [Candidatus Manganitrophus sp.]
MPEPKLLRNSPITEAIIDFQVKSRIGFRAEEFQRLKTDLAQQFPAVEERRGLQATFGFNLGQGPPPVMQDLGLQGYFFKSSDKKTIAQFRVDGFTFNRLPPYTGWEELFPQAMELWQLYSSISKPEAISRLAVRNINRIVLPTGDIEFNDYLRAGPIIPQELPQSISGFLTRVTINDPRTDLIANVAQALEVNPLESPTVIILDIDVYKQAQFSIDSPMIEHTFSELRTFKDLIFFNYLTETTLRRFE